MVVSRTEKPVTIHSSEPYNYSYNTVQFGLEEENKMLKACVGHLQEELERVKQAPLIACTVKALIKNKILIKMPNGSQFLVTKLAGCPELFPGDSVVADQRTLTILEKIPSYNEHDVEKFIMVDKPAFSERVGGLEHQKMELHEVIELPLLKPERFKRLGIHPPKGVLLHGPPGTGKTLLARSVASSTNATFIHVTASELVQKFIGEGARLVKELFVLAKEKSPSIVFIDEIDAISSTRLDVGTGGDREVQRTFLQLLSEIDGFESLSNVKIIGCTNRKDIIDPALLRPGRMDRLIEVPVPTCDERKNILSIYAGMMNTENVQYDSLAYITQGFTGADIKAACTEAGYNALREESDKITHEHFISAVEKVKKSREEQQMPGEMFG